MDRVHDLCTNCLDFSHCAYECHYCYYCHKWGHPICCDIGSQISDWKREIKDMLSDIISQFDKNKPTGTLTEDDFCRSCGEVNRHSLSHYCDICMDRYEWVRRVLQRGKPKEELLEIILSQMEVSVDDFCTNSFSC